MSFPLFNLPTVAKRHVIRSMGTTELLFTTFASKRTKNLIRSCLPRNQFDVLFYFSKRVELKIGDQAFGFTEYKDPESITFEGKKMNEEFIKEFINHVLDVINHPNVTFRFNLIREEFGLELIRLSKERGLVTDVLYDDMKISPDIYKKILDEFQGDSNLDNSLNIGTRLPIDFQYRPETPLKLKQLTISNGCHWIQLEDFMDCVSLCILNNSLNNSLPQMTPHYLNRFFKKLEETDCRIQEIKIYYSPIFTLFQFQQVVHGLKGLKVIEDGMKVEFERENGKKSFISMDNIVIQMGPID